MVRITNFKLNNDKTTEHLRIVQVSDLHGRDFGPEINTIADMLHRLDVDVIVATGDISDRKSSRIDNAYRFLQKLVEVAPVYYTFGNHEQTTDESLIKAYLERVENLGVKVLRNNKALICGNVIIHGLEMPVPFYKDHLHEYDKNAKLTVGDMQNLLGICDHSKMNILLAHDPQWFDVYAEWGTDLVLSGHIHGGVVNIPGVGGLLSPNVEFFPKYFAGEYKKGDSTLIVSRGLNNRWPFSITNPPEIPVININISPKYR